MKFWEDDNKLANCNDSNSEDEILNVDHAVYDAEPINDDRCDVLEEDVESITEQVNTLRKTVQALLHSVKIPDQEICQMGKKDLKALGISPKRKPSNAQTVPLTLVMIEPHIAINLNDGRNEAKGEKS